MTPGTANRVMTEPEFAAYVSHRLDQRLFDLDCRRATEDVKQDFHPVFAARFDEIGKAVAALRPQGVNGNDLCNGMATALGRFLGGLLPPGSDTIGPAAEFAAVMRHAARDANAVAGSA